MTAISGEMIAVARVRGGVLPAGADEACAEAGGRILLFGDGLDEAAAALTAADEVVCCQSTDLALLAELVQDQGTVILPASPDGRDLAPRLAFALGRVLYAGAVEVTSDRVSVVRTAGRVTDLHEVVGPAVVTLVPGVRGVAPTGTPPTVRSVVVEPSDGSVDGPESDAVRLIAVLAPDPMSIDLSEAKRIVGGGQGLGSVGQFELLGQIGSAIGASLGGTRVASDAGWIPFERQIGTTGVAVRPSLYLAFGVSGATQHTSGLGDPDHIVSVNTDPSCPMMSMADLAIVSDANAVLIALARRLGIDP